MTLSLPQSPTTFADFVAHITTLVLADFDREIVTKQLRYHNREHINGVQQRASRIFEAVRPYWAAPTEDLDRLHLLLNLCAIAHDMIQIFVPQTESHTPRRRESGVSEMLTLQQLLAYIQTAHQYIQSENQSSDQFDDQSDNHQFLFTDEDIRIIEQSILATICAYDPDEQAIYQPNLYQEQPISLIARIIALADIGTFSMEGIEAYNREGSLLFLEDNPDILPLIQTHKIYTLNVEDPELHENFRQRLLRRTRFQVSFARSRLSRLPQELIDLPSNAIPVLMQTVFQYSTIATLQALEAITPIAADTSLEVLLQFFQFETLCTN
jgi:hypothetical protein